MQPACEEEGVLEEVVVEVVVDEVAELGDGGGRRR
jgi:hypothetical protein